MSHSKIRIAAIGLGNRTCKYLRFVQEHQDVVELVATIDSDPSKPCAKAGTYCWKSPWGRLRSRPADRQGSNLICY